MVLASQVHPLILLSARSVLAWAIKLILARVSARLAAPARSLLPPSAAVYTTAAIPATMISTGQVPAGSVMWQASTALVAPRVWVFQLV